MQNCAAVYLGNNRGTFFFFFNEREPCSAFDAQLLSQKNILSAVGGAGKWMCIIIGNKRELKDQST